MTRPIIRVEGLSKSYRIRTGGAPYATLRESLVNLLRRPMRRRGPTSEDVWALRDVSFEVQRGDAIAVLGRNGAGKSTLLKVLSRITEPTAGRVELTGRVASLLEVGTGFHHELSGRENVFLNGAILGMRKAEIQKEFDSIVAFAGVERFIDEPVKHYSSGMYMRLAFAVAAHLQPEILIVDEVLAVGDAEFQQKCLGKMGEVAASGRTVIFVTHNMQAAAAFCRTGFLLEEGRLAAAGDVQSVIGRYLSRVEGAEELRWTGEAGTEEFVLRETRLLTESDGVLRTDRDLRVRIAGEVRQTVYGLIVAVELWSSRQTLLAYSAYDDLASPPPEPVAPGPFSRELVIPANSLAAGSYEIRFDIGIHHKKKLVDPRHGRILFRLENVGGVGRRFPSGWTHIFRPGWSWRAP